jgi:hypothetical protein
MGHLRLLVDDRLFDPEIVSSENEDQGHDNSENK